MIQNYGEKWKFLYQEVLILICSLYLNFMVDARVDKASDEIQPWRWVYKLTTPNCSWKCVN